MFKAGNEPIPGYRLERFLGRGSFGQVWRSTAPGGGIAALKFLDLHNRLGWKEYESIQRIMHIRHPRLLPISALWLLDESGAPLTDERIDTLTEEPTGQPSCLVVATPLADQTLFERLGACRTDSLDGIPAQELIRYMREIADGIDFLNVQQAIQHCDLKPENIMLMGGSALVADFGLARIMPKFQSPATASNMIGSLAYMSPECAARKPSRASDQYSLAITYAELRTGSLPFSSELVSEIVQAHHKGKLKLDRLPAAERKVIRRATAVQPEKRYPSVSAMVEELADTLRTIPPANTLPAKWYARFMPRILPRSAPSSRPSPKIATSSAPSATLIVPTEQPIQPTPPQSLDPIPAKAKVYVDDAVLGEAHLDLGYLAWNSGEFTEALAQFRIASELGSVVGTSNLGVALILGRGTARDEAEGVKYIRRAANAGYLRATKILADCYRKGIGVDRDLKECKRLLGTITSKRSDSKPSDSSRSDCNRSDSSNRSCKETVVNDVEETMMMPSTGDSDVKPAELPDGLELPLYERRDETRIVFR